MLKRPEPARWFRAACATSAVAALPLAWWAASAGYGLRVQEPWRDVTLLLLISAAEEIVFRGGAQRALLRWSGGRSAVGLTLANVATSVLFAAAHLWNHTPLAALGVLPVSLLLGWIYERGGERLAPPVALHAWFNLALYACSWWIARAH